MGIKFEEIILGINSTMRRLEVEFDVFSKITSTITTFTFITGTEPFDNQINYPIDDESNPGFLLSI